MSNFLQLCQDLCRDCGVSGTGPASVVNQTGELARMVRYVRDEYIGIQAERPNWRWLRKQFTLQTSANVDAYAFGVVTDDDTAAFITRFSRWWTEEFQIYLASAGVGTRHAIPYFAWPGWRSIWLTGNQNAGYPSMVAVDPSNRLRLGAKPDGIYTLAGEYQRSAQVLAADADVPEMPDRFHRLIVARGMKRYAAYHSAPEVMAEAELIEEPLIPALQVDQLPPPRLGRSLV